MKRLPSLEELLRDPMMRKVMASARTNPDEIRRLLAEAATRRAPVRPEPVIEPDSTSSGVSA